MSESIQTKRLKKDESRLHQHVMYGEWKDLVAKNEVKAKWDFTKELRELSKRIDGIESKLDIIAETFKAVGVLKGSVGDTVFLALCNKKE